MIMYKSINITKCLKYKGQSPETLCTLQNKIQQ